MRRLSLVYTVDIKRHCIVTLIANWIGGGRGSSKEVFMGLMQDQYRYDPFIGATAVLLFGVIRNLALKHDAGQRRFDLDRSQKRKMTKILTT